MLVFCGKGLIVLSSFDKVEQSLANICHECSYFGTDKCNNRKCSIGFSKSLVDYAKNNSTATINDGYKLIPKEDFKYYNEELIADSLGEICKLCKECRENHSEQCIISLCRRSLEGTILHEDTVYPGNILMYIIEVSKQNQNFAEMIKRAYERK